MAIPFYVLGGGNSFSEIDILNWLQNIHAITQTTNLYHILPSGSKLYYIIYTNNTLANGNTN